MRVLDFIKQITFKDIVYIIIIITLSYFLYSVSVNSVKEEQQYSNNITALNDTISLYKTKNGDLIASKTIFECNIKDLEHLNDSLHEEIKKLKSKNEILSGVYLNGTIENPKNDTIYVVKHDTIHNGFNYPFSFNNNWRDLEGNIVYKKDSLYLSLNKDIVKFDYTVGIDDKNKIYINSNNPYVKYNNISGFTVPTYKPKRIIIGPSITTGYSILHNRFDIVVGLSATLNLYKK